jgi:hypothetical protein
MAQDAEEKTTDTPEYGCFSNPFPPAPEKKGAAPAPATDQE